MPTYNSNCKKKNNKKRKELCRYSNPQPLAWLTAALTTLPRQHTFTEHGNVAITSVQSCSPSH
jgi:hypothetical protein